VAWRWAGVGSRLLAGHRCCWGCGNRVLSQCSEGEREREMGAGTDLVVHPTGDGSGATSTYTVAKARAADLVTWLCYVVVVIGKCTSHWGWLNDVWQWLLEAEVKEVGRRVDGCGG